MAKHIEVTGVNSNPVYIPSESIMKIVASDSANTCVFTYIGGGSVTGTIALANAAAARALEASLNKSWLACINDGPDAAGVVKNSTVFTAVA
jgi:alcohol dehydrogenase YqhD (iron-dependent ADH family)